jgi:Tfp pilus assembly protein FimV
MKRILGSAGVALALYLWVEADSLKTRSKQDAIALQNAQSELDKAQAQLAEKTRQLASTQAALDAATAQPAQTRLPLSNLSDSSQPATNLSSVGFSPFIKNIFALAQTAADLDRRFKSFPEFDIPEIALLTESDWISIAAQHSKLNTADQIRTALKHVSALAESKALQHFQTALMTNADPTAIDRIESLLPKLREELPEDVIQRYELIPWARLEPNAPQREYFKKDGTDKPLLVIRPKATSGKPGRGITVVSNDGKRIDSIIADSTLPE